MARFFADALRRRPAAEARDIYKLHYQGAFGVGHLITSREAAFSYLQEELTAMGDGPPDPLTEPCAPDSSMLRVNLRPFRELGLDAGRLVDAMMESVRMHRPDTAAFIRRWQALRPRIPTELRLDLPDYDRVTTEANSLSWPAVHHSAAYARAYRPAYRVILRSAFRKFFPDAH